MKRYPKNPNAPQYPKIRKPTWTRCTPLDWGCAVGPFSFAIYWRVDGKFDLLCEGKTLGTHDTLKLAKDESVTWMRSVCSEILQLTGEAGKRIAEVKHG